MFSEHWTEELKDVDTVPAVNSHETYCRPTVVGYCQWTLYTNWIYWQDEVSWGFEHIFLWRVPNCLGPQLCNNAPEPSVHNSSTIRSRVHKVPNICDTARTEMSVENIKASVTSTLKPEREKCKHTNKKQPFWKKKLKTSTLSLFEAHNTLSKIKSKLLWKIGSILKVLKLNCLKSK